MIADSQPEIERLAWDAAGLVAGPGSVKQVEVHAGQDMSDEPAYFFTFQIDNDPARLRPGLLRIRLIQQIRDDLLERGDERYPFVTILDRSGWENHTVARSG